MTRRDRAHTEPGISQAALTDARFVANSAEAMTEPEERDGQGRAPVLSEEPLENSSGAVAEATEVAEPARGASASPQPQRSVERREGLRPRHRQALLRRRLRPDRRAGRRARRAAHLLSRDGRPDSGALRGRQDPCLQGLPRAAQRRARPLQGRPALPPGRRPRRGPRAGDADDLEDRDRRHPVRRRQGRRQLPQRPAQFRGAAVDHALADGQDRQGAGPEPRHHGARRRHERPGDGVADGRVRQAPRPHAGDRDRQADRARGLLRPRVGDRPRPRLPVPRGRSQARPVAVHDHRRGAGLRQRRVLGRADPPAARREDHRRLERGRRDPQRRGHRRREAARVRRAGRQAHRVRGRRGDLRPTTCSRSLRRARPRGPRRHDPRGERRPRAVQGPAGGSEQPDHAGRGRDPPARRAST